MHAQSKSHQTACNSRGGTQTTSMHYQERWILREDSSAKLQNYIGMIWVRGNSQTRSESVSSVTWTSRRWRRYKLELCRALRGSLFLSKVHENDLAVYECRRRKVRSAKLLITVGDGEPGTAVPFCLGACRCRTKISVNRDFLFVAVLEKNYERQHLHRDDVALLLDAVAVRDPSARPVGVIRCVCVSCRPPPPPLPVPRCQSPKDVPV